MRQAIRDFAKGMGQALDMGGTLGPSRSVSTFATQNEAIASYWRAVGGDLRSAMNQAAAEAKAKAPNRP